VPGILIVAGKKYDCRSSSVRRDGCLLSDVVLPERLPLFSCSQIDNSTRDAKKIWILIPDAGGNSKGRRAAANLLYTRVCTGPAYPAARREACFSTFRSD
jgi:hypothetical protein